MARLRVSVALVVVLSTAVVIVSGDWFAECPRECMCKWISGKKAAICAGLLLDDIPRMSSDIQHLNLTDNNIQALGERAVAAAGVPHVQKLYLSRCKIREIDKSAFAELGNMIELDLSYNQIPSLHPATFKGLNRLRKLVLRGNPLGKLVAYQFPPLRHLTSLDLGECRLTQVDPVAFVHLKTVEVISLRGNRFERLRREPFLPLKNLKSLELFDNPWRCDCLLKDLREWLLDTKLYAAPTSCSQPERLHGRTWDTIGKEDFACKPSIEIPDDVVVGSRGDNVTLSCKFAADPPASTKWVLDGRILTNMSQIPFGDQLYVITEGTDYDDSSSIVGAAKWLNLTITNINEQDAGNYKCVGVNPGGLAERNVTLRFSSVEPAASPVKLALSPLVIAGISVAALVVFLTVVFLSITCFYRRKKNAGSRSGDTTKKQNGALVVSHHSTGSSIVGISPMRPAPLTSRNGGSVSYEKVPEAETRLNSTGDHDEKSFEDDLLGTESEEFAFLRNDGASGSRSSGSGAGGVRSLQTTSNNVYGGGESSSRSTRTPETASLHSDHPPNYFGGGVHNNSHHHYQHGGNYPDLLDVHQGRKYSAPASSNNYAEWPSTGPASAVAPMGYVTLPRRPRASWSHPVAPVVPPSPVPSLPPFLPGDAELMSPGKFRADPVYDNLGPRTTADGTLRRSSNGSAQSAVAAYFKQQMMQQPHQHQPDYYPADYPAPSSMADYGPSVDYCASRRAFQYSTLPRSTPNVSEAQYSHHHGGFRLPPVREESLGAADVRQRPTVQSLRRDRRPGQHPLSPERPSSTATDVSLPPPAPVANNNSGPLNDDSDDADLELPPPPESLMADPKPAVNKKVPPKPPPKPTLKNFSVSKETRRETLPASSRTKGTMELRYNFVFKFIKKRGD